MNSVADRASNVIQTSTRHHVRSALVRRLITAREDHARLIVRRLLLQCSDERLKTGLGLTDDDIRALRSHWRW